MDGGRQGVGIGDPGAIGVEGWVVELQVRKGSNSIGRGLSRSTTESAGGGVVPGGHDYIDFRSPVSIGVEHGHDNRGLDRPVDRRFSGLLGEGDIQSSRGDEGERVTPTGRVDASGAVGRLDAEGDV